MTIWAHIAEQIGQYSGQPFDLLQQQSQGGGCINDTNVLEGGGRRYFVKINQAKRLPMFEAEAEGLRELAAARAVRVPQPLFADSYQQSAYLVMEYIPMRGGEDPARFGEQLAALHRHSRDRYGWHRDNTIGTTPQINTPTDDWLSFWREHRLGYQLRLAEQNGYGGSLLDSGYRLLQAFPALFEGYTPTASLLHGDLWGGNYAADEHGNPVIFDPAVYYGDREADLAMTELFGGFPPRFYQAYKMTWPLDRGYAVRKSFYNLYHILNHMNLFGGGYAGQSERMIAQLLAEL